MTKLEQKLIEFSRLMAMNMQERCKHMSFLCIRSRVLYCGVNSYTITHPLAARVKTYQNHLHSEICVFKRFNHRHYDISRASLYNVRIALDGSVRMAKPCKSCTQIIDLFPIKRMYYTTNEGVFERLF